MLQKINSIFRKELIINFFLKLNQNEKGIAPLIWLIIVGASALGGLLVYENWPAILKGLIGSIMLLLISIATSLAKFSGAVFNSVGGSALLSKSITRDPMVLHGWTIVRNFANMFVVLGFVVVGLATILRLREYEAQKLLLPLIIVALLINFSLLFTGIIIDATNITMNYFTQISGPAGITQPLLDAVTNPIIVNNIRDIAQKDETNSEFINASLSFSLFAFIAAMIFFIYAVLFLFRYVALMCLVILSPLGFVCYVFPATKPIFKKWWEQFTQWAIIGIPAAFFVYLGGHLIQNYGLSSGNFTGGGADLAYWIPVGFLLFAYSLIFQTSAIGASAAMGLATGAVRFAWGATKGTAKFGGKQAWNSRAGQWARDKAGKGLEWAHLRGKGSTEAARKQRLDEPTKRLEKAYDDNPEGNAAIAKIATQRAFTAKQQEEKAAAAGLLYKRNAGNYIPENQREATAAHAAAFGVAKETITAKQPHLITGIDDKAAQQKLMNDERVRLEGVYAGTSATPQERERLIQKNLDRYKEKMSPAAVENAKREMTKEKVQERKLGAIPATDEDVRKRANEDYKPTTQEIADAKNEIGNLNPASRGRVSDEEAIAYVKKYSKPTATELDDARKTLTTERAKEKTLDFTYATRDDARKDLIDKEAKKLREKGITGSQLDSQIKTFSDNLTPANIDAHVKVLTDERESKAIAKLTVPKLRELPEPQIDASIVQHSNYKTFSRAALEFTTEQKEKYKKLIPDLIDKKRLAVPPPKSYTGTADQWKELSAKDREAVWKLMKPADIAAEKAKWTNEQKTKIRDLNNKIKTIQDPNF